MSRRGPWDEDDAPRGGGIGGDWRAEHPRFDSPMTWSLPLPQVAGVTVRIHVLALLLAVTLLVRSLIADSSGGAATAFDLPHTAFLLAILFCLVLAHEIGHVTACRLVGGTADEILIWPLGGLAMAAPPPRWQADLITALGGLAVNALVGIATALSLGLLVGWKPEVLLPNPVRPVAFASLSGRVEEALFLVHWLNLLLFVFNLLPIFPMDGGQALRAVLSRGRPPVEATRLAARTGLVGSLLLCVAAFVQDSMMVAAVGAFGAWTCWSTLRRIEFGDAVLERGGIPAGPAARGAEQEERLARQRERDQAEERARVDAILEKIAREGQQSLTWSERRTLRRATRRMRDGDA